MARMTTRYRQPARLRQLARLAREQKAAEDLLVAKIEARNKILLEDQESDDPSTPDQLAAACGKERSTISVTLKRLRERTTNGTG